MPRGGCQRGKRAVDLTEEEIRRVYVESDLGLDASCKVLQCSKKILIQALRMYEIPSKSHGRIGHGRPPVYAELADHAWLKEQLATRTFKAISKELAVSVHIVRGYAIRHGLYEKYANSSQAHKASAKKTERETKYDKITAEDIHRVYLSTDATILQACESLQCSLPTLLKAMKTLGISSKSQGRPGKKWTPNSKDFPQLLDKEWLKERMTCQSCRQIAVELGTSAWNVKFHAHQVGLTMDVRWIDQASGATEDHPPRFYGPYRFVYCPTHPEARDDGYIAEHRLVLEKKLGRYLFPNEHGHHIDDNKRNNDPGNLEALTKSEHAKRHHTERKALKMLEGLEAKWRRENAAQAEEIAALKIQVNRLIVDNQLQMFEDPRGMLPAVHHVIPNDHASEIIHVG